MLTISAQQETRTEESPDQPQGQNMTNDASAGATSGQGQPEGATTEGQSKRRYSLPLLYSNKTDSKCSVTSAGSLATVLSSVPLPCLKV